MSSPVTRFDVDRRTWFRGQGGACSRLVTVTGKRCCLGFLGRACGISLKRMTDIASPAAIPGDWPDAVLEGKEVSHACAGIINTNDAKDLTDKDREEELRRRFADIGLTVRFTH